MLFGVRASSEIHLCAIIAKVCECQRTTSRSTEKKPRMKRSTHEVQSGISTARYSATLNQMRVLSSPRRGWRKINPSRVSGCFFVACSCGTSLRLMRLGQHESIIYKQMRLTPALALRRHLAVCMGETEITQVIHILRKEGWPWTQYRSILLEILVVLTIRRCPHCYVWDGSSPLLELSEKNTSFSVRRLQFCSGRSSRLVFRFAAYSQQSRCCKVHVFWTKWIIKGTCPWTLALYFSRFETELCCDLETRVFRSDKKEVPLPRPLKCELRLYSEPFFLEKDFSWGGFLFLFCDWAYASFVWSVRSQHSVVTCIRS